MASGMPQLPGFVPTQPIEQTNFQRVSHVKQAQNKDVNNKQPTLYPLPRQPNKLQPSQQTMLNPNYMSTTHDTYKPKNVPVDVTERFQPDWVQMDRHVLSFSGFFKESVVESKIESYRIRQVTVFYYLEDNSVQINENKQTNSGIPQGAFLKRQKILRSDKSGSFIGVEDFQVGQDIEIFGKVFHLNECDLYTREFYENIGKPQAAPEIAPNDEWEKLTFTKYIPQKDYSMKDYTEHKLGGGKVTSQKQFLENDRKVLRYFVFSEVPYVLHYYLADDTVEIREVNFKNSGRDPFPMMLRRQKLPKKFALNQPGQIYAEDFVSPQDFKYGEDISVFGRNFLVQGCDPYTQKYYLDKFGIDFPLGSAEQHNYKEYPPREIPPYNGFGDEEDSLGYVYRLIPKPPKKDFFQWVDNQVSLRFVAQLNTTKPEDVDRRFIITFYLNDDSLMVYEPTVRNSGIPDGQFLEKRQYQNVERSNEIFNPSDLIVGRDVKVNGYSFNLLDCDEYTRKWYQENFK